MTETAQHDEVGHAILEELSPAKNIHRWYADVIRPHLGDRVLEIGSGVGNISRELTDIPDLTLSDVSPEYRELLAKEFANRYPILEMDLERSDDWARIEKPFNSIVALNVLEHVEQDQLALSHAFGALSPGGTLCLLVPQHPKLMSKLDRELGHFRRYTRSELEQKLVQAGFVVESIRNFNAVGIPGWYLFNTVLGRTSFGTINLAIFNTLVPLFRLMEAIIPLPGLSVVAIARRPA